MMTESCVEGIVRDTDDPQQLGRVRVWCPSIDGDTYTIENLPWAYYLTPLAGQVYDYPAGPAGLETAGPVAYGFWAMPKVGATVIVGFLYGDTNRRFCFGSYFGPSGNRSLPAGRNATDGPKGDAGEALQPATASLSAQFQGNLSAVQAQTRGAYERQAAQAKTQKDGTEGYQDNVKDAGLDPQTYCLVTPGHHAIIMQDNPANGRLRLKTANGHQIILDDANERIYVSTAKGQTWIELDQDGRVHVYAGGDISVTTGGSFNLTAGKDINLGAGGSINLGAKGTIKLNSCQDFHIFSDAALNITAGSGLNMNAGGKILQTGEEIHLNGPQAPKADCADAPAIAPAHEPWPRPDSKAKRGKYWKA